MSTVIYYPSYSQVQVHQYPLKHVIAAISKERQMIVTFAEEHDYQAGQNTAFIIMPEFGMQELNSINGNIIEIVDSLNVRVDINSTYFSTFAYPSPLPNAYSLPYAIPNAEGVQPEPPPLPYGNQRPFFGTVYNNGIN